MLSHSGTRTLQLLLLLTTLLSLSHHAVARRVIQSTSLNSCMPDGSFSGFSATLFNITFTPDDGSLSIKVNGVSSLSGRVTAKLSLVAYGYTAIEKDLDPCSMVGFEGMCPMATGQITLKSTTQVGKDVIDKVPGTLVGGISVVR